MKTLPKLIKRVLSFMLVFTVIFVCSCNNKPSDDKKPELKDIIIGSDEYRPYIFNDENGNFSGIDVELATEAFARMGYRAVFKKIQWSVKNELLESGEINCLWGSFTMTGREDLYTWAGPYLNSVQSILVPFDSPIYTINDLNGKSIALQATSKPDEYFSDLLNENKIKLDYLYCFTDVNNVFAALRKGYADAVAGHKTMLDEAIKIYPENSYRFLEENIAAVQIGVAFLKGTDQKIADELTVKLNDMLSDGTTRTILEKYGLDFNLATEGLI